jgi:hypothetical protein
MWGSLKFGLARIRLPWIPHMPGIYLIVFYPLLCLWINAQDISNFTFSNSSFAIPFHGYEKVLWC